MTWTFIVTLAHTKLFNEKKNIKTFLSHTFNFSFLSHTFKLIIPKFLPKTLRLLRGHFAILKCILLYIYFSGSIPNGDTFAFSHSVSNDNAKFNYCWRSHINLRLEHFIVYKWVQASPNKLVLRG